MLYLDATCPLVSKVHVEAERLIARGHAILLIGHAGHPEVIGTMGQLPEGAMMLVETVTDAEKFAPSGRPPRLYHADHAVGRRHGRDRSGAEEALSAIAGPHKEDICYATTNRQEAMKRVAPRADAVIVIGAPNSSNSQRLVEVARRAGAKHAMLIQRAADIDWSSLAGVSAVGLSAGASAPEVLVEEVIAAFRERYELDRRRNHGHARRCRVQAAARAGGLRLWPFTPKFPPKTWNVFLAAYDMGRALVFKGIAEGVENSNYFLHTERGAFILTLYEKRVQVDDLPFFLGLMEHLAKRGLPCPTPVRGRDGEIYRVAQAAARRQFSPFSTASRCAIRRPRIAGCRDARWPAAS